MVIFNQVKAQIHKLRLPLGQYTSVNRSKQRAGQGMGGLASSTVGLAELLHLVEPAELK